MGQTYINAVCFVRSVDYYGNYCEKNREALRAQMTLYNEMGIPGTYLLEYDALERENLRSLLENRKNTDEVGCWFEITGGLCRDAGVPWRSKRNRDWDYYVDPGFIMSYTEPEMIRLCDTMMEKFRSYFGDYPRTVGAWLLDSRCMAYLNERYGMDAYIICREQWGMDGYTLWGGPYFGGYYPSRNNMLTPAWMPENQVDVPVFRMYLSDPIYSYYEFSHGELSGIDYHLFTQEPAWRCGQDPQWVDWCLDAVFGKDSSGFRYYQLGQETSFGMEEPIASALRMQCERVLTCRERYGFEFAAVSQMGRAFRAAYRKTPRNVTAALRDWAKLGNQSVWFHNGKYRANVYVHGKELRIRDLHLFDDTYTDRFLNSPCRQPWAVYDNLPLVDGVRFTEGCDERDIPYDNNFSGRRYGDPAGLYLEGAAMITGVETLPDCSEVLVNGGEYRIRFFEEHLEMEKAEGEFTLDFRHKAGLPYLAEIGAREIRCRHRKKEYSLVLEKGRIKNGRLTSQNGKLVLKYGKVQTVSLL